MVEIGLFDKGGSGFTETTRAVFDKLFKMRSRHKATCKLIIFQLQTLNCLNDYFVFLIVWIISLCWSAHPPNGRWLGMEIQQLV